MTSRSTSTLLLAVLAMGAGAGCGSGKRASAGAGTAAALSSAARSLESRASGDRDGDGDDDGWDDALRVSTLEGVLNQLRVASALAPLFERYGVPSPIVYDDGARGLVSLLRAVRIRVEFGTLTITNRETGDLIYVAPMIDLGAGTLQPEHLLVTTPPPASGA